MSAELLSKIIERRAVVGILGLGYVGLPLAVEFGRGGFNVLGFDLDAHRTETINSGVSYIPDVSTEAIRALVEREKLQATTDFSRLKEIDAAIICVPTPLRKTKEPDISYILAASEQVRANLRSPQLVILESTTYPGTTDEVLLPMLEDRGLALDKDFFLAFSPERVDPGNPQFQTHNIPKVVGGVSAMSTEIAAALYQTIVERVHKVSSARVAETAKLLENTFRSVNIALVNEMAQLCHHLGIDSWEVIHAAATKPFGFMAFYPGPGIGGHCLVGQETIIVRSANEKIERVTSLAAIFAEQVSKPDVRRFTVDGAEIIYAPGLEALSLDAETQQPVWKPLTYLFRRKYEGEIVTVTTSDNRRLKATDKHPMLVSDEQGRLRQVFARDLMIGDQLPALRMAATMKVGGTGSSLDHNPVCVSVHSIDIKSTKSPIDVYSVEVEDTHTFATSFGIYAHNCIPLDPHYLSWKARLHGFEARFIGLAEEVNSHMPRYVVGRVQDALNDHSKPLRGSRVLVLGVAYKRDIDDVRESPALAIVEELIAKGAGVSYHDSYIAEMRLDGKEALRSEPLTDELIASCDCALIVTDHSNVDYSRVARLAPLILDTRNVTRKLGMPECESKIIRL